MGYQQTLHHSSSISLTTLPLELRQKILCYLDISSLQAVSNTCSSLYYALSSSKELLAKAALLNEFDEALLPDTYLLLQSMQMKPWSEAAVKNLLDGHENATIETYAHLSWSLTDIYALGILHQHIKSFAADFASSALSAMNPNSENESTRQQLSATENRRIERAFIRFELYCRLFGKDMEYGKEIKSVEQVDIFLVKLPAWEIEQLACVHDYLFRRISVAMNDVAEHDIIWGVYGVHALVEPSEDPYNEYHEAYLMFGLKYLSRLYSAQTYEDRYKLLSSFPDRSWHSLHKALDTCTEPCWRKLELYNYDLYINDLYNPEAKVALLKDRPFASPFDSEDGAGPYESWAWAHLGFSMLNQYDCPRHEDLRRMGYVMWDLGRLKSSFRRFNTVWTDERDRITGEDLQRKKQRIRDSWRERRIIFSQGGSGWWAPGDESKIFWHNDRSYATDVMLQLKNDVGRCMFRSDAKPNSLN